MAINQARSDKQLQDALMLPLKNAVDYVVQKIWNENRDMIRHIIYQGYQPTEYHRTGEFRNAWSTDVKTVSNVIQGEFKYDPRLLTINESMGQHASLNRANDFISDKASGNYQAVTKYLAEIIYEGLSGAIYEQGYASESDRFAGQPWTEKRNVWEQLEKWLGKNKLRQLFEEGMKREGLQYNRHVSGIKMTKTY